MVVWEKVVIKVRQWSSSSLRVYPSPLLSASVRLYFILMFFELHTSFLSIETIPVGQGLLCAYLSNIDEPDVWP